VIFVPNFYGTMMVDRVSRLCSYKTLDIRVSFFFFDGIKLDFT